MGGASYLKWVHTMPALLQEADDGIHRGARRLGEDNQEHSFVV
jgi:hypothetical protein